MMGSKKRWSRREFLGATAVGASGAVLSGSGWRVLGATRGANDKVNMCVIGVGGQGTTLVRNLALIPTATITGICDIFEPNLKRAVGLSGGQPKTFSDYRKLLEDKTLNAVVIAAPLHMHSEIA